MSLPVVADQIRAMQLQEDTNYCCRDYLHSHNLYDQVCADVRLSATKPVDEECRKKICKWFYELIDLFELSRDTVAIAMSYLDRFLSSSSKRARRSFYDRKEYQLAAITTLYMSIKLHCKKLVQTQQIARISHGVYSKEEIEAMEIDILFALNWHLHGPTILEFAQQFLALLPQSATKDHKSLQTATVMEYCRLQSEFATGDYFFVSKKPSIIAIASICNALNEASGECFTHFESCIFFQCIAEVSGINPVSSDIEKISLYLKERLFRDKCESKVINRDSPENCVSRKISPGEVSPKCVSKVPSAKDCRCSNIKRYGRFRLLGPQSLRR